MNNQQFCVTNIWNGKRLLNDFQEYRKIRKQTYMLSTQDRRMEEKALPESHRIFYTIERLKQVISLTYKVAT